MSAYQEEKRIEKVTVCEVENEIASCNGCDSGNYKTSLPRSWRQVDRLYKVKVGCMALSLCEDCLRHLANEIEYTLLSD